MSILANILEPLTLEEFRAQYLFQKPFASQSTAKQFRKILSWDMLAEIFATGHADCWLPKSGKLPPEAELSSGILTFPLAHAGYESGRTVLVRHAECASPRLRAISEDFFTVFNKPIDIQLYCTPAGEEGFGWHQDIEDVFVIQSSGSKEFSLRETRDGQEMRCLLAAGDWLYIPSGCWHKAKAFSPSFHLSVGVLHKEASQKKGLSKSHDFAQAH